MKTEKEKEITPIKHQCKLLNKRTVHQQVLYMISCDENNNRFN